MTHALAQALPEKALKKELSLTDFALEEFSRPAPVEWQRRLREISPISPAVSHLRFRFRSQVHNPGIQWLHPDEEGVWEIYACTPKHLIDADRAEGFRLHWSELPKAQQIGRRAIVSSYQHYMWHTHGVEAMRFWVLQGPWGGTPATYTPLERRTLDAAGMLSDPFPLGLFPSVPFDERAVKLVLARDRLLKAGQNLDALKKMDSAEALAMADVEAEQAFRTVTLETWSQMMAPAAEYLGTYLGKKAYGEQDLPKPAKDAGSSAWRESFLEHGSVPNAGIASTRATQILVK